MAATRTPYSLHFGFNMLNNTVVNSNNVGYFRAKYKLLISKCK